MTDKQHIKLNDIGNEFWVEFSQLVARCVDKRPDGLPTEDVLDHLQERASVYGSNYGKFVKKRT